MAACLSISGDNNTGTMGGYVTLEQNGIVRHGILTNYHVTRPSDAWSDPPSSFLSNLDRYGSSPSKPPKKLIEIECLAKMDWEATLDKYNSMDESIRNHTQVCMERIKKLEMAGDEERQHVQRRMIDRNEEARRTLRQNRDGAKKLSYKMGHVLSTSGKVVIGRRVMDWAFIELSKNATRKFFRPNRMFAVRSTQ